MPSSFDRIAELENREGIIFDEDDVKRIYAEDMHLIGSTLDPITDAVNKVVYSDGEKLQLANLDYGTLFGFYFIKGEDTGSGNSGGGIAMSNLGAALFAPNLGQAVNVADGLLSLVSQDGELYFDNPIGNAALWRWSGITDYREYDLPDKSGTVALTSDLPAIVTKYKTSAQIVNDSTTLVDDDDLYFEIGADEVWGFRCYLLSDGNATADIQIGFDTSEPYVSGSYWSKVDTDSNVVLNFSSGTLPFQTGGVGYQRGHTLEGVVINDDADSIVQMKWAQNVAHASDTQLLKGSYLIAYKLS